MFNFQAIKKVLWLWNSEVFSLIIFIFIFVLLNKEMLKCSLLQPVAQDAGGIKAYGVKTLSDRLLVPPVCSNVVQVIMFTRANHKLNDNFWKLKLHYYKSFFFTVELF